MSAIFYILRTGCQWKELSRDLGASSTVMTDFRNDGERLVYSSNVSGLITSLYNKNNRIDWKW
jgi:transposase